MILNKFISSRSVIEDVFRDMQSDVEISYEDLTYYIYECLGLMDRPLQFVRKVTGHKENPDLDVTNYRAELPCDFYKLERIAVDGLPVRYANNSFHHLLSGDCCDANTGVSSAELFTDNFGNQFSPQSAPITNTGTLDSVTFDINDNFITLSVKEGKICMAYLAFPVDSEGFPMIPDDITYKVALKKYLMYKLRYIDWSKDPSNTGKRALFEYDESEYMWYVGKALSKSKIPHPEEMESLKNQILTMIPNVNSHDTFYKTLGAKHLRRIN